MTIKKLKQKANLWLVLHAAKNFNKIGENMTCEKVCKYYKDCKQYKSILAKTRPRVVLPKKYVYKRACIKWLDDVGWGENEKWIITWR